MGMVVGYLIFIWLVWSANDEAILALGCRCNNECDYCVDNR